MLIMWETPETLHEKNAEFIFVTFKYHVQLYGETN